MKLPLCPTLEDVQTDIVLRNSYLGTSAYILAPYENDKKPVENRLTDATVSLAETVKAGKPVILRTIAAIRNGGAFSGSGRIHLPEGEAGHLEITVRSSAGQMMGNMDQDALSVLFIGECQRLVKPPPGAVTFRLAAPTAIDYQ